MFKALKRESQSVWHQNTPNQESVTSESVVLSTRYPAKMYFQNKDYEQPLLSIINQEDSWILPNMQKERTLCPHHQKEEAVYLQNHKLSSTYHKGEVVGQPPTSKRYLHGQMGVMYSLVEAGGKQGPQTSRQLKFS